MTDPIDGPSVRATLDVSHKAAGQRGILSASYNKTEGIYSPGQRGILRERGAYPREAVRGYKACEAEAQGVRDPEVEPQRPKGRPELRRIRVKANDLWKHCVGATSGVWVNIQRLRNAETPKRRNAETPKRRNAETPKRRSSEVLKLRNVETLRRRRFWDCEKLRNSETPKRRTAEAPKRRGIVTPRHHGPQSWARGSGGSLVVAANLRTSESPNRRTAGGPSAQDPEYANLANSSPGRGQQLSLPADWPVWPQVSSERDRERPWRGGGGGGGERERAEVEASMVPSEIVQWWLRTAEPPNLRIAQAPDRRIAETPDLRIAETLDLRITEHLSHRTYEAPKVVRRAPEVVRSIVDVGGWHPEIDRLGERASEVGSYTEVLGCVRRYREECGGIGRHADWGYGVSAGYNLDDQETRLDESHGPRLVDCPPQSYK
ncbi:hypothetical protein GGX14DRAFT_387968 [Mycena pura]|uniref:Uncharacterized protein n=1 Tax=Mycena pura TaxID=153505 RepID=A0AAD6YKQ7_9AGAR|nr:hypothetical protein GGX14DRAFT_387968 [Mycena pura]